MDALDQLRQSLGDTFNFVRKLGEGRFAEVFLAWEKGLDRPVAVKVLRTSLANQEAPRRRFLREARLSARIQHPNVVAVHRVGELDDGRPYLVMEYIDGQNLQDFLAAAGPLAETEVRRILSEVSVALDVAHGLGIIHRDLRPGNIMRTRDGGRYVLTDFGLAGVLETGGEAGPRLTVPGEILGGVRYAAPEQLEGGSAQPSLDIYSLAVTAYELLTGQGPFPESSRAATMIQAHLVGEPTPIRSLRPTVSASLEDTLLRCLQKRPEQRPTAGLLRELLAEEPGAGRATPLEQFLGELKRRRVYRVGAAYGAFILIVLAFVDAALPAMPFPVPDWLDTALVMGAIAGLPLALLLGWFYDLTSGGVERTRATSQETAPRMRLLQGAAVVLLLGLTAFLGWILLR
jgi:eukaryotic-like serine/threonine-protein kinase